MSTGTRDQSEPEVVPLSTAVFCLDCEVISASRTAECPACRGRALVSLARILGGSVVGHELQNVHRPTGALFEVTLTIRIQHMQAEDLSTTLEGLTSLISPQLVRGQASFHINVEPKVDGSDRRAA